MEGISHIAVVTLI